MSKVRHRMSLFWACRAIHGSDTSQIIRRALCLQLNEQNLNSSSPREYLRHSPSTIRQPDTENGIAAVSQHALFVSLQPSSRWSCPDCTDSTCDQNFRQLSRRPFTRICQAPDMEEPIFRPHVDVSSFGTSSYRLSMGLTTTLACVCRS